MRVVIAHEWFTVMGGSDKTFLALAEMFPEAELVTAVADPATLARYLPDRPVRRLFVDAIPGARTRWKQLAPAIMAGWMCYRPGDVDLLITSSHFAATAAGWGFEGRQVAYCHTPMRLAWRPDLEHARLPLSEAVTTKGVAPLLRRWDRAASRSVDDFVVNSTTIAERVGTAYGRCSTVIHPPVDTERFLHTSRRPAGHLLAFGRLVAYKRFDLAIAAANQLGMPLVVAGDGPEAEALRAMAGPTVRFVGRVSDEAYAGLLAGASALLFPGEEDFGIVPVEAHAAGCPVVAYGVGGALDTVSPGVTGQLFAEQSVGSVADAIQACLDHTWDEDVLRSAATPFSKDHFIRRFRAHLDAA